MSPISSTQDHQIRQVIRSCGQLAESMASGQFQVFEKGPNDYVTTIDAELDQQLSAAFSKFFPADGVITEEDVQSRKRFLGGYSRLWCIDPLDGTEDFIHGNRDYSVMAGLLQDYEPTAGWIYAPAYDRLYFGGQNWGIFEATADTPPTPVLLRQPPSPSSDFCPVVIGHRDRKNFGAAITELIPEVQFYSLGSFGLKVMEVVLGRAGLYVYFNGRVKIWDTTGPLALARAAGLVCCDLYGQPLRSEPNAIDAETLAHRQTIVVGWAHYVDRFRSRLEKAVGGQLENPASLF